MKFARWIKGFKVNSSSSLDSASRTDLAWIQSIYETPAQLVDRHTGLAALEGAQKVLHLKCEQR